VFYLNKHDGNLTQNLNIHDNNMRKKRDFHVQICNKSLFRKSVNKYGVLIIQQCKIG
jgi:hypothetical protein